MNGIRVILLGATHTTHTDTLTLCFSFIHSGFSLLLIQHIYWVPSITRNYCVGHIVNEDWNLCPESYRALETNSKQQKLQTKHIILSIQWW